MARPFEHEPGSRTQIVTRFDSRLIKLLDGVSKKYGYARNQTLEFLVINAIMENHIPQRHQGIDELLKKMKEAEVTNVVRKDKLVPGKPGADKPSRKGQREHLVDQKA